MILRLIFESLLIWQNFSVFYRVRDSLNYFGTRLCRVNTIGAILFTHKVYVDQSGARTRDICVRLY